MAEVHSTKVRYISKAEILNMIEDYTGNSYPGLGYAATTLGYTIVKDILKKQLPAVIHPWALAITTVVASAQLLKQITEWTDKADFAAIMKKIVEEYKEFDRIKVTLTYWQEYHVGPTMGYYTYYTTTSYAAV